MSKHVRSSSNEMVTLCLNHHIRDTEILACFLSHDLAGKNHPDSFLGLYIILLLCKITFSTFPSHNAPERRVPTMLSRKVRKPKTKTVGHACTAVSQ